MELTSLHISTHYQETSQHWFLVFRTKLLITHNPLGITFVLTIGQTKREFTMSHPALWMVCGQETDFLCIPVPKLITVVSYELTNVDVIYMEHPGHI